MKEIIFTEEDIKNPEKIGKALFSDESDPRSTAYVRKLERPRISLVKTLVLYMLIPAAVVAGIIALLNYFGIPTVYTVVFSAAVLLVYLLLAAKRMVVCAVKIYQKYAPASVRDRCRFEPSCSEYMILAIEKYGLIKGVKKGLDRLKRCNIDGGGFDWP